MPKRSGGVARPTRGGAPVARPPAAFAFHATRPPLQYAPMVAAADILAAGWLDVPLRLATIFYQIVLPILLLAAIGYALQRFGGLDMFTLRRLNFYLVVPGVIYTGLVVARVTADQVLTVVVFSLGMMAALASVAWLAAAARGVPRDRRNALLMTTMFYNSGNFGLPLQDLAFRSAGMGATAQSLQVFVMVPQNFVGFTIGVMLAASGGRGRQTLRQNLGHILRLPPIYALLAAVVTIQVRSLLGEHAADVAEAVRPFWQTMLYIRGAFIGVALVTLGAQLGTVRRQAAGGDGEGDDGEGNKRDPVALSVFIRLLIGPALGLGIIYVFGLEGFIAQVLLISTSSPTAVNSMLMCLEFDNHPDFAARAVLYSTLLAPVTVTLVILLAHSGAVGG